MGWVLPSLQDQEEIDETAREMEKEKKSLVWSDPLQFSCSCRAHHVSVLLTAGAAARLAPFRKPKKQVLKKMKPFGRVRNTLHFYWKRNTFRSAKQPPYTLPWLLSIFLYTSIWGYRDTDILTTEKMEWRPQSSNFYREQWGEAVLHRQYISSFIGYTGFTAIPEYSLQ